MIKTKAKKDKETNKHSAIIAKNWFSNFNYKHPSIHPSINLNNIEQKEEKHFSHIAILLTKRITAWFGGLWLVKVVSDARTAAAFCLI